jgi:plastocyanin
MIGVPLAYGDGSYDCDNSSIAPTEPALRSDSSLLKELTEGDRIVIATTVSDRCGMDHPAIVILEVRDSNDVTVFLGLQNFTIQANSQTEVGLSWVPRQAGEYQLRAFTLVSFDSLGSPKVATSKINVAESNKAIVVIPYDPNPSLQQLNFEPDFIKVIPGVNNTVLWTNADAVSHRLVGERTLVFDFEDPPFIYPGYSFSHTFTKSGLFEYHDKARPWMYGFIRVLPSGAE